MVNEVIRLSVYAPNAESTENTQASVARALSYTWKSGGGARLGTVASPAATNHNGNRLAIWCS